MAVANVTSYASIANPPSDTNMSSISVSEVMLFYRLLNGLFDVSGVSLQVVTGMCSRAENCRFISQLIR